MRVGESYNAGDGDNRSPIPVARSINLDDSADCPETKGR